MQVLNFPVNVFHNCGKDSLFYKTNKLISRTKTIFYHTFEFPFENDIVFRCPLSMYSSHFANSSSSRQIDCTNRNAIRVQACSVRRAMMGALIRQQVLYASQGQAYARRLSEFLLRVTHGFICFMPYASGNGYRTLSVRCPYVDLYIINDYPSRNYNGIKPPAWYFNPPSTGAVTIRCTRIRYLLVDKKSSSNWC